MEPDKTRVINVYVPKLETGDQGELNYPTQSTKEQLLEQYIADQSMMLDDYNTYMNDMIDGYNTMMTSMIPSPEDQMSMLGASAVIYLVLK